MGFSPLGIVTYKWVFWGSCPSLPMLACHYPLYSQLLGKKRQAKKKGLALWYGTDRSPFYRWSCLRLSNAQQCPKQTRDSKSGLSYSNTCALCPTLVASCKEGFLHRMTAGQWGVTSTLTLLWISKDGSLLTRSQVTICSLPASRLWGHRVSLWIIFVSPQVTPFIGC